MKTYIQLKTASDIKRVESLLLSQVSSKCSPCKIIYHQVILRIFKKLNRLPTVTKTVTRRYYWDLSLQALTMMCFYGLGSQRCRAHRNKNPYGSLIWRIVADQFLKRETCYNWCKLPGMGYQEQNTKGPFKNTVSHHVPYIASVKAPPKKKKIKNGPDMLQVFVFQQWDKLLL